jgi:hypothetical protein
MPPRVIARTPRNICARQTVMNTSDDMTRQVWDFMEGHKLVFVLVQLVENLAALSIE